MKPKKPDKFERAVLKESWDGYIGRDHKLYKCIDSTKAIDLLRKEHKTVVQLIRRLCNEHSHSTLVRDCLIDHLTRRAR